ASLDRPLACRICRARVTGRCGSTTYAERGGRRWCGGNANASSRRGEAGGRRGQGGGPIVPELGHLRLTSEGGPPRAAPHAAPASVDDADFVEPGSGCGVDVVGDYRGDIPRRKRMEINLALDGQVNRRVRIPHSAFRIAERPQSPREYSAVTVVLIPPRTEK